MTVVTRQRALREGHPTVAAGDTCWFVPEVRPHRYGDQVVPAVLLGEAPVGLMDRPRVLVRLLEPAHVDGVRHPAGQVISALVREVGPKVLREHALAPERPGELYRISPKWALDLFCPVHGVIHDLPTELCDGEPVPAPPLPGDAVRLASPWAWAGSMVNVGDVGVLGGNVGKPVTDNGSTITFHARTFRDDHGVCCSGGPATTATPAGELTRTDETVTIWAWEWRDGIATAHNGLDYQITVPVWDWRPTD